MFSNFILNWNTKSSIVCRMTKTFVKWPTSVMAAQVAFTSNYSTTISFHLQIINENVFCKIFIVLSVMGISSTGWDRSAWKCFTSKVLKSISRPPRGRSLATRSVASLVWCAPSMVSSDQLSRSSCSRKMLQFTVALCMLESVVKCFPTRRQTPGAAPHHPLCTYFLFF